MKCNDFIFDWINSLYHKCHDINLYGSYVDSPDWIKITQQKVNVI